MEIKGEKGKLNKREECWHDDWRGQVATVHSVDDALYIVEAITGYWIHR